jgi:chemotaxis protein MotB
VKTDREQPILIVKRGGRKHGGGHGGAWKVAFADFMTSMMCLFLVLWLVGQSAAVRMAIAGYFQDPLGRDRFQGSSPVEGSGTSPAAGHSVSSQAALIQANRQRLQALGDRIRQRLEQSSEWKKVSSQIEIQLTDEGLRIQLLEDSAGTFFPSGSASPSVKGRELLALLGGELIAMPNPVVLEGHTDARPYHSRADYTNWELSADRANAARRILESGLRPNQLTQVRGYADQKLRTPADPYAPTNRRVTILMLNETGAAAGGALSDPPPEPAGAAPRPGELPGGLPTVPAVPTAPPSTVR